MYRFVVLLFLLGLAGCSSITIDPGLNQIQLAIYHPLCIDVLDASTASGQHLQAYPCGAGKLSQEWNLEPVAASAGSSSPITNQFIVVNQNSQMCMSVADDPDTAPGQYVIQAPCAANDSDPDQVWKIVSASIGETGVQFISAASGQCLDLPYGATAAIFDLQQYTCTASDPAQGWRLHPVQKGSTP